MFLRYIHRFRAVAIIFIVTGHCVRLLNWNDSAFSENISKSIFYNGTVYFMFISGYLFQYLYEKYNYKKYLLAKLKNILIPYFIISIPIIFYLIFIERLGNWTYPGLNEKSYIFQILWYYIKGKHLAPLWFIPMIVLYYITFPILIEIDKNKWCYISLIPVTFVISLIVHRSPGESSIIQVFMHFFSIYLIGMCASHFNEYIYEKSKKYFYLLVMAATSLILIELISYKNIGIIYDSQWISTQKEIIDINIMQKLILCFTFVYVLQRQSSHFDRFKYSDIIDNLGSFSFSIFLIHYYFVEILLKAERKYDFTINGNLFTLFLCSFIIIVASYTLVTIVKKILGQKSRILIGY